MRSVMLATFLQAFAIVGTIDAAPDTLIHRDGRMFDGVELTVEDDIVVVFFDHGTVEIPIEDVLELVIESVDGFVPKTDAERARVAKGQVPYKGKWMSKTARDKLVKKELAARREEVEERKEGRLWRNRQIFETKNFLFESTAPPHITEYYRDLCEAYFQEFAKTWKIKRGKAGKLNLKLYVDQENFMQVTGMSRNTYGFFRFLEPYQLNIFYDRLDPEHTEEVMFHELGHYLQKLIDVDFSYPHWPGEALSEYYGASTWDPKKKKVEVGKVLASRVQDVRYDIDSGERVTVIELLEGAPDRIYHDYTWGWTFVHFLMSDKRHTKNFTKFYVALAKAKDIRRERLNYGKTILKTLTGETMLETFKKYMKIKSDKDMAELQQDWYDHIDESLIVSSTRGLENAAFKNLQQGRQLRAKRLFEEAIEKGTENSLTFYRYAELLDNLNEPDKARRNWEIAIEHDPLVPLYYISLGEFHIDLATEADFSKGEEFLRLALDIEPENFYLERNLERILRDGQRRLNKKKSKKD